MELLKKAAAEVFDFFVGDYRALIGILIAVLLVYGLVYFYAPSASSFAGAFLLILVGAVIVYTTVK